MSETVCNFRIVDNFKLDNPGKDVDVRPTDDGWLQVYVDGVAQGQWFLDEVTDRCVC